LVRGAPAEAGKWRLCLVRAFMPSLGLGGAPAHRPGPSMRTHPTRVERRARPSRPRPCPCAAVLFIVSCYLWYHRTCRKDARIKEDLINCTGPARHQRLGREASKNVFFRIHFGDPKQYGSDDTINNTKVECKRTREHSIARCRDSGEGFH
jgi:hypothetical protein